MKRTKEEAEITKKTLVDIAMAEFVKKGFEGTKLVGIAKKAGVTRGAIYWHFKNKDELYDYFVETKDRESLEVLKGIYESGNNPLEKLRKIIAVNFPELSGDKEFRNYIKLKVKMYNYYLKTGDKRKIGETYLKYAESLLCQAAEAGQLSKDINLHEAAYTILSLITGLIVKCIPVSSDYKSMKMLKDTVLNYVKLLEK